MIYKYINTMKSKIAKLNFLKLYYTVKKHIKSTAVNNLFKIYYNKKIMYFVIAFNLVYLVEILLNKQLKLFFYSLCLLIYCFKQLYNNLFIVFINKLTSINSNITTSILVNKYYKATALFIFINLCIIYSFIYYSTILIVKCFLSYSKLNFTQLYMFRYYELITIFIIFMYDLLLIESKLFKIIETIANKNKCYYLDFKVNFYFIVTLLILFSYIIYNCYMHRNGYGYGCIYLFEFILLILLYFINKLNINCNNYNSNNYCISANNKEYAINNYFFSYFLSNNKVNLLEYNTSYNNNLKKLLNYFCILSNKSNIYSKYNLYQQSNKFKIHLLISLICREKVKFVKDNNIYNNKCYKLKNYNKLNILFNNENKLHADELIELINIFKQKNVMFTSNLFNINKSINSVIKEDNNKISESFNLNEISLSLNSVYNVLFDYFNNLNNNKINDNNKKNSCNNLSDYKNNTASVDLCIIKARYSK